MAPVLKKINKQVNIHHLSPTKVIMWGYSLIILVGSVLLCLPVSSRSSTFTNFLDCVFTATSATCVTGLVIYDTYTHWSLFGQLVILLLIQIGGLGFMTLAISAVTLTKKHIGLRERYTMKEAISAPTVGGVVRISRFIFLTSIAIEATGALLLSIKFIPQFGIVRGIYFSIFHSISAFCNAGFDLMGIIKPFSSLATYQGSVLVNLVICFLIIIGGLGFFVWDDIRIHRFKINKYKLHTKIVLTVTSTLILIGFLSILFLRAGTPPLITCLLKIKF